MSGPASRHHQCLISQVLDKYLHLDARLLSVPEAVQLGGCVWGSAYHYTGSCQGGDYKTTLRNGPADSVRLAAISPVGSTVDVRHPSALSRAN
ncbi:hypothetical protein Bbelb_196980, partial [Branchiostoma belcheri]